MIKYLKIILFFEIILFTFCGCSNSQRTEDTKTIRVGALAAPHAEILEIAQSELKEQGYSLEIVEYSDYESANDALQNGEIDANYVQNQKELELYNQEKGTTLFPLEKIHYDRFALYYGDQETPDLRSTVSVLIPSEPVDQARALKLLEKNKFIQLDPKSDLPSLSDITEKKVDIDFRETASNEIILELLGTDIGALSGNQAVAAALNVNGQYALKTESKQEMNKYPNVLVVKEEDKKDEKLNTLRKVLKSERIRSFINNMYEGNLSTP